MKWMMVVILIFHASNVFSQTSLPLSKGFIPGAVEVKGEGIRVKVWEKDPFVPPSVQAVPELTGREVATDFGLSTILFSDEHSSAVINGKIYHIGDDISGHKILDIKRSHVILGGEKKTYRLELKK
ncbi:MAG: hypothetical protein AABY54_06300 [Deltaproteobacteria bacterium]